MRVAERELAYAAMRNRSVDHPASLEAPAAKSGRLWTIAS
jgi:hypothetical protein